MKQEKVAEKKRASLMMSLSSPQVEQDVAPFDVQEEEALGAPVAIGDESEFPLVEQAQEEDTLHVTWKPVLVSFHPISHRLSMLARVYYQETVARTLLSRECCHVSIIKRILPRDYHQDSAARTLLDSLVLMMYDAAENNVAESGLCCQDSVARSMLA
jgi:hypothetical protein